jgi:hydroxymethylglutaryl-CoA lyase
MQKEAVVITEVGLRDGLQNQPEQVSTANKIGLAEALIDAGIRSLEAVSFVHPKVVPQMADASEVLAGLPQRPDVKICALVPNMKGYERARDHHVKHIGVVLASTDSFNQRNLNMTLAQTLDTCRQVIAQAKQDGVQVRAYISGACACPYDGITPMATVHDLAARLIGAGADEISIADTTGAGHPRQIHDLLVPLIETYGADRFNLHLHDTRGLALANAWEGIRLGIRKFDSSIGGLGGCPFAPGASGNLATEDLVYLLNSAGFRTGIELAALRHAVRVAEQATSQELGGRIMRWLINQEKHQGDPLPSCS